MSIAVVKYWLPEIAEQYLCEQLMEGYGLSRRLLEIIKNVPGRVWTYMFNDVSEQRALQLDSGGLYASHDFEYPVPLDQSELFSSIPDAINHELRSFARQSPVASMLIEDHLASPSDPWINNAEGKLAFFQGRVYEYYDRETLLNPAHDLAQSLLIPMYNAALSRFEWPHLQVGQPVTLTEEQMTEYLDHLSLIAVCAYEDESVVFWAPSRG